MPWVEVDEPFAAPPRLSEPSPVGEWDFDPGSEEGWLDLDDALVEGDTLNLEGVKEVSIRDCVLRDVAVIASPRTRLEIHRCRIERSDLSGCALSTVVGTRFVDSKLVGVDLSESEISNVSFERCTLRLANLRLAKLQRVCFETCDMHEADLYGAGIEDLVVPGSRLTAVSLDRVEADRFDLRGVEVLQVTAVGALRGFLVSEAQLAGLTDLLALATGIGVQRRGRAETGLTGVEPVEPR